MKMKLPHALLVLLFSSFCTYTYSENTMLTDGLYALAESFLDEGELTTSLVIVNLKTNGNNFVLEPAEENSKVNAKGTVKNDKVSMIYKVKSKHTIKYTSTWTDYNYAYGKSVETIKGKQYTGSWEMKKIPKLLQ